MQLMQLDSRSLSIQVCLQLGKISLSLVLKCVGSLYQYVLLLSDITAISIAKLNVGCITQRGAACQGQYARSSRDDTKSIEVISRS